MDVWRETRALARSVTPKVVIVDVVAVIEDMDTKANKRQVVLGLRWLWKALW